MVRYFKEESTKLYVLQSKNGKFTRMFAFNIIFVSLGNIN